MKECTYCLESRTNIYEKDVLDAKDLIRERVDLLPFGDVLFQICIDEYGKIVFGVQGSGDWECIAEKRIRFCPICGRKIPKITPTREHELERAKLRGLGEKDE